MKVKFLRLKKISWKLTIIYALIFSLVLILLNAGILYGVKFFLIQQSINRVENSSDITAKKILGTPGEQTPLSDPELLNEAQANSDINIKIADPSGNIVNSSNNFNTDRLDVVSYTDIIRKIEAGEKHLMVKNSKIMAGGKIKAFIQVVENMEKDYTFIKLLFVLMAAADFFGIIISVIAGYVISRRILKPIDKITKTAKNISISDLNSRIEAGEADDELARLAVTFNEMIDRLQLSFEKQNKFVSDASHELRTPISVIQGYIGLIDRWGKEDRNVLQEAIDAIKNETAGMTELIEKLLFLARGESGNQKLQKNEFSLNKLITEVVKESQLISQIHHMHCNMNEEISILADRKMLKQMLRALIDNSIKFTPPDGDITVQAYKDNNTINILIEDTGVGIPEEAVTNIFNRFYRVDKARAKETGGSGLGLSIVKWIVDAHGGSIRAESVLGKGTGITIILPQN